jgi:hypothetical protein
MVKLMDNPAQENQNHPGKYECLISNFIPVPGTRVSVTFDRIPKFPGATKPDQTQLIAQATIRQLIAITAPLPDAHVALSATGFLNIEWTGSNHPYYVGIVALPGSGHRLTVFSQTEVAGTSLSVPLTAFKPNTRHVIHILAVMEQFRFSEIVDPRSLSIPSQMVDPGSLFHLLQAAEVYFYTE